MTGQFIPRESVRLLSVLTGKLISLMVGLWLIEEHQNGWAAHLAESLWLSGKGFYVKATPVL